MKKWESDSAMKRLPIVLALIFASLAVLSPILGTKAASLFGIKFAAGTFTILLAYSLLDVVNELWGREEARFLAVSIVLIRLVLFLGVVPLIVKLPVYLEPEGYAGVLHMSLRTFLASEIATLVQNVLIDIPIFHALKKIKFGFLFRANLSNIISWTFGTVCFVLVSYWGAPKSLVPIIIGQALIKFPLSFIYAGIGFLIVRKVRGAAVQDAPGTAKVIETSISKDA